VNIEQALQQCGNNQALSCCNTVSDSVGGLLGSLVDGVLGGSCQQVNVARNYSLFPSPNL
jgi:hypothetical protein